MCIACGWIFDISIVYLNLHKMDHDNHNIYSSDCAKNGASKAHSEIHNHAHNERHNHGHNHAHNHGDHGHNHTPEVNAANSKAVAWAAIMTGAFMGVELLGGIWSGSLALIADAGHMLTDFAALVLAWLAFWMGAKRQSHRLPLYAAAFNCITLFAISAWILWEAYHRFYSPSPVLGNMMLIIAFAGLVVNVIVLKILAKADGANLNIRAANMHVIGDLLGSVAAVLAAIIIIVTGWSPIDPILSVVVALLILRGAWAIGGDTWKALQLKH